MSKRRIFSSWIQACILTLPVWLCFLAYFTKAGERVALGFFQDDNPLYISYARQYLDQGHFSLFYSNPFNESDNYPRIYFQLQNFWYALQLKAGIAPGWIMMGFTLTCSLVFFRIMIALVDYLFPQIRNRPMIILLMAWGGGLLFLCSIPVSYVKGSMQADQFDNWFFLDPAFGWWGLNLGRSLLFSAEAYYHCLFFGGMLLLFRQKWVGAVLTGLLLTASHPFTGIEFLMIANTWLIGEKLLFRNRTIPLWVAVALAGNLVLHLWYYLMYLPGFADHASVQQQYSINWHLRYFNILPAYCLVGFLAWYTICRITRPKDYFADPKHRLLLAWFLGVALLSNHDLFIKPMQPLHFTRGYMYSALFMVGIPALDHWINRLRSQRFGAIALAGACLVFLSDNIAWMVNFSRPQSKTGNPHYITKGEFEVLQWMKGNITHETLVVSVNRDLSFMVPAFTNGHSWVSHIFTTPFYEKKEMQLKAFIADGRIDSSWQQKDLLYIAQKSQIDQVKRLDALRAVADSIVEFREFSVARFRNNRLN